MWMAASPRASTGSDSADRFFIADGARLRYRDEGSGPAVVLLHGWTLDLEMWEPQVAALREGWRLVRLDRRGHGQSSGAARSECDASDLAALCRHLGLERVALFGMSQGARGVLGFAATAPARVSCLVLDGPPDLLDDRTGEEEVLLSHYRSLVQTGGIDAFRSAWAAHPLMQLRTSDAARRALLQAMIHRYPGRELSQQDSQEELSVRPVSAVAAEIPFDMVRAPALIISGESDLPSRLKAARRLCARLPRGEQALVSDAGHLPNLDNPPRYNALCRAFLARHASQPTSS
jgi:pimeloyl-ACP methyl ester carboxylesterase